MKTKLLFIISIIFIINPIFSQTFHGNVIVGNGTNQMELDITVNSQSNTVNFSMSGPSTKWFGFGFAATNMATGAYTIIGNVNSSVPKEYNQVNHQNPTFQSTQNLTAGTTSTNGGVITYTFSRNMNTLDANDFIFQGAALTINLIWAYGSGLNLGYHANKGVSSVTLSNVCNIPVTILPDLNICVGDSIMIFGNYQSQSGVYIDSLLSSIGCDSIVKTELIVHSIFNGTPAIIDICNGDSVHIVNKWYKQSGFYSDTVSSQFGCDSVLNFQIVIDILDTMLTLTGDSLIAPLGMASYQWYDCVTGNPIIGETNQIFSPSMAGSYKVQLTDTNSCTEFSSCFAFVPSGLLGVQDSDMQLYPNPSNDFINIQLPDANDVYSVKIFSADGRMLFAKEIRSNNTKIDIQNLSIGYYIIQIQSNNGLNFKKKIVKL